VDDAACAPTSCGSRTGSELVLPPKVLVEVGPGAVLGERALLEGGARTATLTAVTPVRVAVADTAALDPDALARLAADHRREDQHEDAVSGA
jgi:CRP-like cAMP-binding protein